LEYTELWKVIDENKISAEYLNRQCKKLRKVLLAGKRATVSDVLDFGAFLCHKSQSHPSIGSYGALYPDTFAHFLDTRINKGKNTDS